MELVELVVQGLVGAPDLVRVPFNPGVTALPATARERLYSRVVLDLLYPKGTEPTLADLDVPTAQSRVAIVVVGRDNVRYRLLQDVHTGRRALQRMNGDKAEPVTNAANEISQAVTATIGFPTEDVLRELLWCVKEDLPSRKEAPRAAKKSSSKKGEKKKEPKSDKPLPPGFSDEGAPVVDRAGQSDAQLKMRLADIDAQLKAAEGIKDVEFEIDGLQKKVFEIEAKLRPMTTLRQNLERAEQAMNRFHSIETVPEDLPEMAERLRKAQGDHAQSVVRFDEERERLVESSGAVDRRGRGVSPMVVAQADPLVRYGVIAGGAAVLLGLLGAAAFPPLQWAAFLDIPAFGVALFGGIRVLSELERGVSVKRRVERIDVERKKLDDRLQIEEEQLKSILQRAGFAMEQLADVEDQLKARVEVQEQLEMSRANLAQAEQGGDAGTLEREQAELQSRIRALEEKLQGGNSGYGMADLQAEKAELEALLRGEQPKGAMAAPFEAEPEPEEQEEEEEEAVEVVDACKRQLDLARDILMAPSVEDIVNQVKGRAAQIITALTDGRYKEIRFTGRGESSLVDAAAEKPISFGQLPPFDRDLAYLALKIALVEVIVKRGRLPVVFDRGLDALADTKAPMLKNMLQFIAQSTQVVCLSEKPSLGGRPA
jgi:hypothetical protein